MMSNSCGWMIFVGVVRMRIRWWFCLIISLWVVDVVVFYLICFILNR